MATARKNKAEETPGYCKTEDLANLFGLTGQWINQLTRDGVIKAGHPGWEAVQRGGVRPGLHAVPPGQSSEPR